MRETRYTPRTAQASPENTIDASLNQTLPDRTLGSPKSSRSPRSVRRVKFGKRGTSVGSSTIARIPAELPTLALNKYKGVSVIAENINPFAVQKNTERAFVMREREREFEEQDRNRKHGQSIYDKSMSIETNRAGVIREIKKMAHLNGLWRETGKKDLELSARKRRAQSHVKPFKKEESTFLAEESKDRETQESTTLADRSVEQRRLNASLVTRSPSPMYDAEEQKN